MYSVTTGAPPLNVAVTGGGGAFGVGTLVALAFLVALKVLGPRRGAWVVPMLAIFLAVFSSSPARAIVYVDGADQLNRTDEGIGYTLGVGPRFALGQHVGVGIGADFLTVAFDLIRRRA